MVSLIFLIALVAHFTLASIPVHEIPFDCDLTKPLEIKVQPPSGSLNSSGVLVLGAGYKPSTKCNVTLRPVGRQYGMVIATRKIDLRPGCVDRITVTDSYGKPDGIYGGGCRKYDDDKEWMAFETLGNVTILFESGEGNTFGYEGFQLTFTSFLHSPCVDPSQFECGNFRCVSKDFVCDGHNHCGDRSDQSMCPMSGPVITGIVLGCVLLLGAVVLSSLYYVRRKERRRRTVKRRDA